MIQLTYQPAFDPFHTTYRMLRLIVGAVPETAISRDHFRILDFYLQFPFLSDDIVLTPKHRRFKKVAAAYEKNRPYGDIPEDKVLFHRMASIQAASLDTLSKKGIISAEQHRRGLVQRADADIPSELLSRVMTSNADQSDLMQFLRVLATEFELLGPNGLKKRSGLLEYQYDAA